MSYQNINNKSFPQLFDSPVLVKILSMIGTGGANGVHVNTICRATGLNNREARKAVEAIRRAGVVVCADWVNGYYYPETKEEIGHYITQEYSRAYSILETLQGASELFLNLKCEGRDGIE